MYTPVVNVVKRKAIVEAFLCLNERMRLTLKGAGEGR